MDEQLCPATGAYQCWGQCLYERTHREIRQFALQGQCCRWNRRSEEDRFEVPMSQVAIMLRFTFFPAPLQDPLTEHAIYEQMALVSSVCAFSWSKWNSRSGDEHLVFQVFYPLQLFKLQMLCNVTIVFLFPTNSLPPYLRRASTVAPMLCPRTRGISTCWPPRRS